MERVFSSAVSAGLLAADSAVFSKIRNSTGDQRVRPTAFPDVGSRVLPMQKGACLDSNSMHAEH